MKRSSFNRIVSAVLCLAVCVSLLSSLSGAEAASKALLLEQAQKLALANSSDLTKKQNEIILKKMKYVEAVDGIKAKVKNLRSFRWTPLLSFKFPQQLDLVEEFELNIKPITLQAEIDTLTHELNEIRLSTLADVNKQYTDLYILQEKISFTEERLAGSQQELTQNEARLITGDATEADVEKMRSSVDALKTELSNLKSKFESGKTKLSDTIKLDVSSGYTFRNSLKTLSLPREQLDSVINYALANDHTYYVAKAAASTALLNLNAYESLMKNQYGGKMNYIQSYINQSKQGQDVDYAAFQMKYKEMIKALDKPWAGSIRILFFRFTLEWFKGAISGSRYIEDEMYAVYTACMEYAAAEKERAAAEKELRSSINEAYDTLIVQFKAYESAQALSDKASATLDKVLALNKVGKAEYSEVKDARDNYQEMQLEAVDALATYNTLLYDFDKTTCGAITLYMKGEGIETGAGGSGDSYSEIDPISDPYYYIYSKVADLTFTIGVSIPEGFEPAIDGFEIWVDATQIGQRTKTGEELTHLLLDYQENPDMTIRLYNGDEFVCECVIDASVPRDVLPIEGDYGDEAEKEVVLGSYTVDTAPIGELSTSALTLKLNSDVDAKTYTIEYGEHGSVFTSEKQSIDQSLSYLTILIASLEDVTLKLYDRNGELTYTARFDTDLQRIIQA